MLSVWLNLRLVSTTLVDVACHVLQGRPRLVTTFVDHVICSPRGGPEHDSPDAVFGAALLRLIDSHMQVTPTGDTAFPSIFKLAKDLLQDTELCPVFIQLLASSICGIPKTSRGELFDVISSCPQLDRILSLGGVFLGQLPSNPSETIHTWHVPEPLFWNAALRQILANAEWSNTFWTCFAAEEARVLGKRLQLAVGIMFMCGLSSDEVPMWDVPGFAAAATASGMQQREFANFRLPVVQFVGVCPPRRGLPLLSVNIGGRKLNYFWIPNDDARLDAIAPNLTMGAKMYSVPICSGVALDNMLSCTIDGAYRRAGGDIAPGCSDKRASLLTQVSQWKWYLQLVIQLPSTAKPLGQLPFVSISEDESGIQCIHWRLDGRHLKAMCEGFHQVSVFPCFELRDEGDNAEAIAEMTAQVIRCVSR